ncbi:MAG: hypothetical protein BWY21_02017 [Parcubacteria group bacterium ADurb.Bin216]|jgi:hypothetical protein|nr:MAG: hypothetical protein BWY21_02017 [Parcubacteria group bacterium ADurb.Bin216]
MKGSRVYLRIEEEIKEQWVKRAKEKGMTLSDYVRTLVEPGDKGVSVKKPRVMTKAKKGLKELPSQEGDGFKTYFKSKFI